MAGVADSKIRSEGWYLILDDYKKEEGSMQVCDWVFYRGLLYVASRYI